MPSDRKYRIMTNGIRWRIEKYTLSGWLWWKKLRWVMLRDQYGLPRIYFSYEMAKKAVDHYRDQNEKYLGKWWVMEEEKEIGDA